MSNDQPLKISPRGSGLDIIIDELMIIPSITDFRGLKNYSEFMKLLKANKINSDILKNWYTSKDKIYSSWLINLYTEIFILYKIRYLCKNIESLTLQKIFPYGITVSEDIPQVIIPVEYKDYNNDRFAYNLMMVTSNRNFWYLLTIEEKYELFNLLKLNPSIKLKHVSNVDYCNSDLLEDIVRFQFKYDQYFADIIAYGTDITKLPDKDRVYDYLCIKATLLLLAILAIGAGVATFIENDFGTSSARVLVYNNTWYEIVLVLTTINLSGIIYKFKMWNNLPRFLFHFSFVVILLGAIITRYVGYEGIMQIPQGTTTNQMISLEPYLQVTVKDGEKVVAYKEWQKEFTSLLPELNNFSYKVDFDNNNLIIDYKRFQFEKKEQAKMGLLTVDVTLNGKKETIRLPGLSGQLGVPRDLIFDKYTVTLEYGSKFIDLPFAIRLNEFQLERYPGSMAPSSYASEVTVIKDDKTYDYRIFMNRTLNEGNFLFFQSSYFPDETGTVLSVNNDPGKWPTYFGYFLLTLGLFLNFFDKKSRFRKLTKFVANKNLAMFILTLALLSTQNLKANESNNTTSPQEIDDITMRVDYLNKFKDESKVTADKFGHLVVQSSGGRMKPLATLNREIVQKLSGK